MALPSSRSTTYAVGSQVKSIDLNALQDCIVSGRHGDVVLQLQSCHGIPGDPASVTQELTAWIFAATSTVIVAPIAVRQGDRIKGLKVFLREADATPIQCKLWRISLTDGNAVQVGSTFSTAGTAGAQDLQATLTGLTEVSAANYGYYIEVTPGTIGDKFYGAEVTFDHPT